MTKSASKITSHPIDVHVGQRVRERRRELKMSQQALSDQIDVTFQQVQKYERGANRISASKLFGISQVLGVPIDYFFDGLPDFDTSGDNVAEHRATAFAQSPDGVALAVAFTRLSPAKRRLVVTTVKGLVALQD